MPIELAASNHFNYRHLVKVPSHHDHHHTRMIVCAFEDIKLFFDQDVLAMVAFGLLLSLVFGAVACGGLGSIARQKNIQVGRI